MNSQVVVFTDDLDVGFSLIRRMTGKDGIRWAPVLVGQDRIHLECGVGQYGIRAAV